VEEMSSSAYHTPVFIGLLCVMCFAAVLLLHHCVVVACRNHGRRRRRHLHHHHHRQQQEEGRVSVDMSSSSRVHLVKGAAAVRPYIKESKSWSESTCPVCLAHFADGEPVRVLPGCMHYFHADCIDT
jgi:hypothetical protein